MSSYLPSTIFAEAPDGILEFHVLAGVPVKVSAT